MLKYVVIVDDDKVISEIVKNLILSMRLSCIKIDNFDKAKELISNENEIKNIILFILDLNIDSAHDGLELCNKIRKISNIPVVMLTGSNDEELIVKCLEVGANQYIIKPFKKEEFKARVNAAIKTGGGRVDAEKELGSVVHKDFKLLILSKKIRYRDQEIQLTEKECDCIATLLKQPNREVSREELALVVYKENATLKSRKVDMNIARIRKKIKKNKIPIKIEQIRGYGYKLIL